MNGHAILGVVLTLAAGGCGSSTSPASTADGATLDVASDGSDAFTQTTDISGWYQVTVDLEGTCGAPTPFGLGSPFLWVEHQMSRYVIHACNGSTEADCTGTYFYDFTEPVAGGWSAEGAIAFFSAGCTLTLEQTVATLEGAELHAKSLTYRTNEDIAQADCNLTAARMLTSPCTHEVDLTATRL